MGKSVNKVILVGNLGKDPEVKYTPTSWINELSITATKRLSIAANYGYDKLLYYKGHRGSLELKYLFVK